MTVAVLSTGYVGRVLVRCRAASGHTVVGVDPEIGEVVEHTGTLIVGGHDPDSELLWRDPTKSAQPWISSGSVNRLSIPDTMNLLMRRSPR